MKKLLLLLAGVLLVAGALGVSESPASAHHYDGTSMTTCYAEHTPGWNLILHSHPVAITEFAVDYGCVQTDGVRCQHYFATRWWNQQTSRHDDSPWDIC